MKETKMLFREVLHLPLPLAFVEFAYQHETRKELPWAQETFPIHPYIIYEQKGGQIYAYMDDAGMQWQKRHAGQWKDDRLASTKVKEYYGAIREVIENEKALNRQELRDLLSHIECLFPWLNYIWWGISYREEHNIPFETLLQLRKETEYFVPGFASVLRKSIQKEYPYLSDFVEVISLSEFLHNDIPQQDTLLKRKHGYAFTNYQLYPSLDEVLHAFPHIDIEEYIQEHKHLFTGQTAYPGNVQGRIKIIKKREDIHHFNDGEILVAGTTTPDYLPAIKKAGAIISEHGGALSHASIVSRELHIPCVVGVQHITKHVKDGDLVEVDADNGVVKILERAGEDEESKK